jgi:alkanesulfonate monooxygenase SsuD/methylene tetrahydromethanopterin reductase-like flavin-dependent oxidoreductase (luciferase family)
LAHRAHDEALEIILKAWSTRQRFSHEGRFWRFKNVVVGPPPMQAPHPVRPFDAETMIVRASVRRHTGADCA